MATGFFWSYRELDQCESTQLLAIETIRKGGFKGPFALSCLQQTAGFGRRGDPWIDSGQALALSLAWKPTPEQISPDERWPSWISLWVWRGLIQFDDRLRRVLKLKWPNDLVVGSEKLGGVLVSQFIAHGETYRVAGLGLNLSWVAAKPVDRPVTDLQTLLGQAVARERVLDCILSAVAQGIQGEEDEGLLDAALQELRAG